MARMTAAERREFAKAAAMARVTGKGIKSLGVIKVRTTTSPPIVQRVEVIEPKEVPNWAKGKIGDERAQTAKERMAAEWVRRMEGGEP